MRDIHYQDRWETITSEWPVMEQVTITRTVNGKESTETTHITKRHVVIQYIEATCRLFYNGLPLQHSFPTCLFNSGAVDDGRSLTLDNASELYYALKKVQDYGYHVPDFVFDIIREEINQKDDPML